MRIGFRAASCLVVCAALAAPGSARAGDESFLAEARILCAVQVRIPEAKGDRKPPLLVALHGKGGTAEAMVTLWEALRDPRPIYVVPEAPYPLFVGGERPAMGWSWDVPSSDRQLWARADPLVVDYVLDVVRETGRKHASGGVYLMGHSQGVAYAYMAAAREPELIDGVIAFAGLLPTEALPEASLKQAAGRVRVFIAHGRQDQALDIQKSRQARDTLTRLGFDVTYREFEGGHGLTRDILHQAQSWMMAAEKK